MLNSLKEKLQSLKVFISNHKIYKHHLLFLLILIFEIFKTFNKQSIFKSVFNCHLFFLILLVTDCYPLATFMILLYQAFEVVSYYFCQKPTSLQVINSIDFKWAIHYHPSTFVLGFFVFIVFVIISYYRCGIPRNEEMKNFSFVISKPIIFTMLFVFMLNCIYGYYPLILNTNYFAPDKEDFFSKIENFYEAEMHVSFKNPQKKKNLIIIEMESCEKDILGRFNTKFNKTMPFISSLTKNTTYVDFVGSSMYTEWSVAAMFASQCGFPLITGKRNQGEFQLYKGHRCFGDFLNKLGYNLYSVETGHFVGNFARHLRMHHWQTEDITKHGFKYDMDTFRHVVSDVFPKLKEPFILHISNTDTHPFPGFYVDPRCKKRVPDYPFPLQSFDCFDQILEEFYNSFKQSKFINNTEMIAFSDHVLMHKYKISGIEKDLKERSLNILIPTRPKKLIQKKASIYDLTPTFFDLIDVDYSPEFPFGKSILSNDIGTGVNKTYAKYIYDFFSQGKFYFGDAQYKPRIL